jgi:hypothetical protein
LIMTDTLKMLGQICARPVVGRADQVFHILSFVYHRFAASFYDRKRKS